MRQINICFLTCLNLSVTDKIQNTHALCFDFLLMVKKFVSPDNSKNGNNNKKRK